MDRLRRLLPSGFGIWACFWMMAVSNTLLSYSPFSPETKGWIFCWGIVFPAVLFLAGFIPDAPPGESSRPRDLSFRDLPVGVVGVLLGAAVFLRFYKVGTLYLWPTGDEGLHGFFALDLAHKWEWKFFYTVGEHPPLLIWFLCFCFKFFKDPFLSLGFPPALLSLALVPLAYFSARLFFPRPFSLLCGFLAAFGFWPLYSGRFCHQGAFIPPWELLSLIFLGLFLKGKKPGKPFWISVLGLWMGLGFLTFVSWGAVCLLFLPGIGWAIHKNTGERLKLFACFGLGFLTGFSPFLAGIWREGYGHHLLDISSPLAGGSPQQAWITRISYVSSLFWGSFQKDVSYGPSWGGMLNPAMTTCFFVGCLEICRRKEKAFAGWMLGALFLCLLPGLISADYVELNRVIQVMPLLLFLSAIGIQRLLSGVAEPKKGMALVLILAVSAGLDLFHFLKPALAFSPSRAVGLKKEIPDQNFRAYQILNSTSREKGPGLIFTDFLLLSHNHTLYTTTYSFNAASNPRRDSSQARWAAILVNVHYGPFLQKRFPGLQWFPVGEGLPDDGGLAVGVVPLTPDLRPTFGKWLEVHRHFHRLNREAEDILNSREAYRAALRRLPEGYEWVKGDPFLESVFGEWVAQYHFSSSYRENAAALQGAIQRGYPSAHLYYKLGNFLWLGGQRPEALRAYRSASRQAPREAAFAETLRVLEKLGPQEGVLTGEKSQ